jgi:multiple sugar transport system substrate-binding protein
MTNTRGGRGQGRGPARGRGTTVLVCLTAALASCGGNSGSGMTGVDPDLQAVTITFLRHDNPNYRKADNEFFAAYHDLHPNVTIADTTVDFKSLASMLNSDLKNDQLPYDLLLIPPARLCSFAAHLADVPASVVAVSEAQNTFFRAPLQGSLCDGKLKGLPVEYNLEYGGVVVNTAKYRARFPGRDPGWADWPSFIADAAALSEFNDSGAQMANGLDIDPGWSPPTRHIFLSQILQRGGHFRAPGGNLFDFGTAEAHDALAAMVDWVMASRIMSIKLIPDRNTGVTARLAAGASGYGWGDPARPLSVMGYVGTWAVPSTTGLVPPGSGWTYDYFTLPPMVGTAHKFITDSGWAFAVPLSSKNQAVAWDVARSLALSPDAMRTWSRTTGALPALRANGVASAVASDPVLARVQPLLELGEYVGNVPAAAIDTVNGAIVRNFFSAVAGEKSVDQALADMQATANDVITQSRDE